MVDETLFEGVFGEHIPLFAETLVIFLFGNLAVGENVALDDFFFEALVEVRLILNLTGGTENEVRAVVHQELHIGQGEAAVAGNPNQESHRRPFADVDGIDGGAAELNRADDGETLFDVAARGIDVKADGLPLFGLELLILAVELEDILNDVLGRHHVGVGESVVVVGNRAAQIETAVEDVLVAEIFVDIAANTEIIRDFREEIRRHFSHSFSRKVRRDRLAIAPAS